MGRPKASDDFYLRDEITRQYEEKLFKFLEEEGPQLWDSVASVFPDKGHEFLRVLVGNMIHAGDIIRMRDGNVHHYRARDEHDVFEPLKGL